MKKKDWKLDEVEGVINKYLEGRIPIDDLITYRLKLDEINKAFDLMHNGKRYNISFLKLTLKKKFSSINVYFSLI